MFLTCVLMFWFLYLLTQVLSWKCEASRTCRFTESEFTEGMVKLGCDGIDSLKKQLPSLRKELDSPDTHKEIYQFACVTLPTRRLLLWGHSLPQLQVSFSHDFSSLTLSVPTSPPPPILARFHAHLVFGPWQPFTNSDTIGPRMRDKSH